MYRLLLAFLSVEVGEKPSRPVEEVFPMVLRLEGPFVVGVLMGVPVLGRVVVMVLLLLSVLLLLNLPCLQQRLPLRLPLAVVMTIVAPVVLVMPRVAWFTLMTRETGRSTVTNGTGRLVVVNSEAVATAVALGMFIALTDISRVSIIRNRNRVGEHETFRVPIVNIVSSMGYMLVYLGTLRPVLRSVMKDVTLLGMLPECRPCMAMGTALTSSLEANVIMLAG